MQGGNSKEWARRHFEGARLKNVCRVRRVISIAEAMAEHAGESIPKLFERWYDVKATYNLFRHPDAVPEQIQDGHRKLTLRELKKPGTYLLVDDDSDISFSGRTSVSGLGSIGDKRHHGLGFKLHSTLAVAWKTDPSEPHRPPLEVIGLAAQQYVIRPPKTMGEHHERTRCEGEFESQVWEKANVLLGIAPKRARWVRVCDRAADIYEFLVSCQERGFGFVVRAKHNRRLESGEHLFDFGRELPSRDCFSLYLRERPQHPARTAKLSVSFAPVSLASPQRPGHRGGQAPPVHCTLVRVWEPHPPEGCVPLEWFLLTDVQAQDFQEALTVTLQYSTRWVIEEFHKALKTGMKVENLQLECGEALLAATAVMSVVALRLLDLREKLRFQPDAPAQQAGLEPIELELLQAKLGKELKTVEDVALAVGRLGGHLNRKGDGFPGWQTLYSGMVRLTDMAAGARLCARLQHIG